MTVKNLGNGSTNSTDAHNTPALVASADVLIVGAGPAGASLACFLASYGINGFMISNAPGTADTPRAHITNMAAMECLRDIDLEAECKRNATDGSNMMHTRWAYSMAGEEYARIHAWGHDPKRKGEYEIASPCDPVDLPQTILEPLLVRHAVKNGFTCRFNTTFVSFFQDATGTTSTLRDDISGTQYRVRSSYLLGADGGRSEVFKQLGLELDIRPDQGTAFNIHAKADLSRYMKNRNGVLHWLFQPDKRHPDFGWACIARMVKPWDEWIFIVIPEREREIACNPTKEEWILRLKEWIGDVSIPVELLSVSKWRLNEVVAKAFAKGRVYDPFGLFIYSIRQASDSILQTYSVERQPVGQGVVARANQSFRHHGPIWEALGVALPTPEERVEAIHELTLPTAEGRTRRRKLQAAIQETEYEYHALGQEMGQFYQSKAIYDFDEKMPYYTSEVLAKNTVLTLNRSTYPGCRLPHVWLNKPIPAERISSIDLAGRGAFTILTGIGGSSWKVAASQVGESTGVRVNSYSIGFRQDYEDVYFDWARIRGVEDSGCVLTRPDRIVAWRCSEALDDVARCVAKLREVIMSILGRQS